jgi:hypothetical protein
MHKLAYQDAPKENLQTWSLLIKMLVYGTVATAVFLLLLAAFMT